MRHVFTLFVLVSLAEVMVFIEVGEWLGVGLTIISVIATAAIGVSLLRIQGLKTLQKVQQKMAVGEVPGQEMIEGVLLLIAGALLLTPGFLTDATGFVLLAPLSRGRLARWFLAKGILEGSQWMMRSDMHGATYTSTTQQGFGTGSNVGGNPFQNGNNNPFVHGDSESSSHEGSQQTIEGEFQRKE